MLLVERLCRVFVLMCMHFIPECVYLIGALSGWVRVFYGMEPQESDLCSSSP